MKNRKLDFESLTRVINSKSNSKKLHLELLTRNQNMKSFISSYLLEG